MTFLKVFAKTLIFLFWATCLILSSEAQWPTATDVSAKRGCILPPYPENGAYEVINKRDATPGQEIDGADLAITCKPGYILLGSDFVLCNLGEWFHEMPECLPLCEVEKQTSNGSIIVYRAGNAGTHRCLVDQFPVGQAVSCSYIPASECPDRVGTRISASLDCEVPAHPRGGIYTVQNEPDALPGDVLDSLNLTVTCDYGYTVDKSQSVSCTNGQWSDDLPTCVRVCQLKKSESVEYLCIIDSWTSRVCNDEEPSGTVVQPICKPHYDFGHLWTMHCMDGSWNYMPSCWHYSECGISFENVKRVVGGRWVDRNELPWHAGIYTKTSRSYMQICGGSLVTNTIVISAAHCFWSDVENLLPASQFAVAVGKLYRAWDDSRDTTAQMSDVKNIILPDLYQGNMAKFQDDIALVIVNSPFVYGPGVRPVCLDFDHAFIRSQLKELAFGTVAGWGLTANGNFSEVLVKARLPYIAATDCIRDSSPGFAAYITSDKLCAGLTNGTAVCRGDSGGGLAFPVKLQNGSNRYFLRGVASTAPPGDEGECNIYTWATFTNLNKHQDFITDNLERNVA